MQHCKSPIIKAKLNKVIEDLNKLLSDEKMQIHKCTCVTSVSLKYLITLYGRLLKTETNFFLYYQTERLLSKN